MANLQVKGIDDDLYRALRRRAALENRSISQEVVTMIQESLARPRTDTAARNRVLLELAGSWQDERTGAEIAADLRRSRRNTSRRRRMDDVLD